MKSVSGNPKGLSARALHAAARSRTVFIALLLLPTIGGVTWTLPAQFPADTSTYVSWLTTSGDSGLDEVCAGDSAVFAVTPLRRRPNKSDAEDLYTEAQGNVIVDGSVLNPRYGTLKPASFTTNWNARYAVFTFAGLRPGSTKLRFTGVQDSAPLKSSYRTFVPTTREVKVVSCDSPIQPPIATFDAGAGSGASKGRKAGVKKVKVKTIPKIEVTRISKVKVTTTSTWSVGMDIVATIDEGVMDADDQGHFAGSADVTWQTSVIGTAACGAAEYRTPPSRADLTGEIDESNQLVVTITFQPRDFSGFARCGPVSGSTANIATPDPLTVSVATTGGTSTQTHAVTAKNGSFAGSVTVVVTTESK